MNRIGDSLYCTGENEEIVRIFTRSAVEFVVIGGLAVAWHCASRQADDMDLLVNPTPENSERVCDALNSLRLVGHERNSFTKLGLQAPLKQFHYAEILTPRADGPAYSEIIEDAVEAKLFNIPIRVASVTSLIRLKEHAVVSANAQREKHLKDIELLISLDQKGSGTNAE